MTSSHSSCTHPATKQARAVCRRGLMRRIEAAIAAGFLARVRATRPYVQLINNGSIKYRQLAIVLGQAPVGGDPGYARSAWPRTTA